MRYYRLYRAAVHLLPSVHTGKDEVQHILCKHKARAASVCLFDSQGLLKTWTMGNARRHAPVTADTYFRTASVAKMVTAMMALQLCRQGKLNLDENAERYLGTALRHPSYPDAVITPRMLLSHTSSLLDSDAFWQGAGAGQPLDQVLARAAFAQRKPGTGFAYSNFGAGVLGAVLEGASGKCLDALLRDTFPGICASFYPQNLPKNAVLADCVNLLPRKKAYDGAALQAREKAAEICDPMHHYALAHGNLCIRIQDLAEIGRRAMTEDEELREPQIPFGARDPHITEGLGMFIIRDEKRSPRVIYGHQGLAYGAVNGVFFDPEKGRGFALLTGGVSLARQYVLADVNRDLIRLLLGE